MYVCPCVCACVCVHVCVYTFREVAGIAQIYNSHEKKGREQLGGYKCSVITEISK